jgi:hypothetical protein
MTGDGEEKTRLKDGLKGAEWVQIWSVTVTIANDMKVKVLDVSAKVQVLKVHVLIDCPVVDGCVVQAVYVLQCQRLDGTATAPYLRPASVESSEYNAEGI